VVLRSDPALVDAHRATCPDCEAFAAHEARTVETLASLRTRFAPPDGLQGRIADALGRERQREARARRRRPALLAAAAALVLLIGGLAAWRLVRLEAGNDPSRALSVVLADDYAKYAAKGPEKLQVATSDAPAIERFFAAEMRIALELPRFAGLAVVGGRKCGLDGRPAALVFLEQVTPSGTKAFSLFVFEGSLDAEPSFEHSASASGGRTARASERGVGMLLWEKRGLVYALAGAADTARLEAFVRGEF
jgi:anti-sigma factor RsiW